ncbi:formaldehyde dehydrogenase AdhA [Phytophthora cinnamomi]|uniref:formaldehyde dehydrogenase AdhA n=1 Tax=Phytophthora cinnamomi TaxID=4785 RepID=UPI002A2C1DD5|nr:formaldehyde dehydrogenase AdhA [Phytophthora cinnamomi]KAJ8576416.1 hypothetical protein ON010_g2793 [Phytophthora cinnamomi]
MTSPARILDGVVNAPRFLALAPVISPVKATPHPLAPRQRRQKPNAKPMSSSERGIKFRQRQREREITLLKDTQRLREEILRLHAKQDLYEGKSLAAACNTADAPMKFIIEYFKQFRIGLHVPDAPTTVLSSVTQRDFLNAWIEPYTKFGDKPAIEMILSVWEHYSRFHTSVKLELASAEMFTADDCSSVVVRGVLHLRYARRTIQHVFPNAIVEEDLVQKLIGRQLHVHYTAQMHFNVNGRLVGYEITPDFVGALMEILGSIRDCERMLGQALIKGHLLGEKPEPETQDVERVQIISISESEVAFDSTEPATHVKDESRAPSSHPQAMDLKYILS